MSVLQVIAIDFGKFMCVYPTISVIIFSNFRNSKVLWFSLWFSNTDRLSLERAIFGSDRIFAEGEISQLRQGS